MKDKYNIKLVPIDERLRDLIKEITIEKQQSGDPTPIFEAAINPKSPPNKKWKLGVEIDNTWYDPAGWGHTEMESGEATGGVNVTLKQSNMNSSAGGNGGNQRSFTPRNNNYTSKPSYGNYRRG